MANTAEHKEVIKGTLWGLAGNVVLKLFSFLYVIASARLFSQSDIGTFYLGLSVINILSIFGDFGLTLAFSRFVPYYMGKGEKNKAIALLKGSYILVIIFSLLLTLGLAAGAGTLAQFYQNPQFLAGFQKLFAGMPSATAWTQPAGQWTEW